jgi:ATP-dependent Zn protease
MKERGINIAIGRTTFLENGFRVIAQEQHPRRNKKKPGETAYHEAEHAVIEPHHVKNVSIVPGTGYNGITEMTKMSATVALGPHSRGRKGTGWDRFIASQMGVNISAAESAARAILASKEHEVEEVAYALEERKTLSGTELMAVIRSVDEGRDITVFIKAPDGAERSITQKTSENTIFLPVDDLPLVV